MKLLIITQKMDKNDSVLGFMHGWVLEFARKVDLLTVICLEKGEVDLPQNVTVLSLGKEQGASKIKYLFNFVRYIVSKRNEYDAVWVHMNQVYVVLGGLFWRIFGKTIGLWYAHGYVPFSLRFAEKMTHIVFTSTESGFRLHSEKTRVIGQGINTREFFPATSLPLEFKAITVGRISPIKDYETLIEAVAILKRRGVVVDVDVVGGPGLSEQKLYLQKLKEYAVEKGVGGKIHFIGAVSNAKILPYLHEASVFVNTSHTGSLDKAGLEAMATGLPVLTCNEAYESVFGEYAELLMFAKKDAEMLAEKLALLYRMDAAARAQLSVSMREIVKQGHSLEQFVEKIMAVYSHYHE
jgi:glycosyltransferase involved in cell wall biosynthesis